MPVISKTIFDNSDDCIRAACGYANKNKEKCEFTIGGKEAYREFYFKILFKHPQSAYSQSVFCFEKHPYKNNYDGFGPLYYSILDKYQSIDDFINNHHQLIIFM